MIVKIMKSNSLTVSYEYLDDERKTLNKRQSFSFLPLTTSDDDYYALGMEISDILKTPVKTIEQSTISMLTEG